MTHERAPNGARLLRALDRTSLFGPLLVALGGLAAWTVGGGVWRLGPVSISLQRPLRSVGLAFALLLVREAVRDRPGGRARLRTLALLAALLAALTFDSHPRIVGDGQEYLAMAWNLGHGRPPALSGAERAEVERVLALGEGELSTGREALLGSDERQDFHHFWLYSAVVAPLLPGALAAGGTALAAFTLANAALLLVAAAVVQGRLGPAAMLVLFGGPLLWWLDKPHPEVFLVALLASALTVAPRRPGLALLLVGLAAAQNPVFCLVLGLASLWAFGGGCVRRPPLSVLATAWGLACANPLYYLHHLGRAVPLRDTVLAHVPNWAELSAVVIDPNLGLLPGWPALALLAAVAGTGVLARGFRGEPLPWREIALLSLAILTLLVAFSQPGNINHGGTRGMSRYALWLAPFAIPALARPWAAGDKARLALAALGALSLVSAFQDYLPSRPERYLEPTPLARWLWTRHPRFDRPLPEVFAERAWGYPPLGSVPAGLPGCQMALVRGDDSPLGRWPLPCAPAEKPAWCRQAGVLCYAQADAGGYRFQRAPRQPTFQDAERHRWYWSGLPSAALAETLRGLPWKDLGVVAPEDEAVFFSDRSGCGRIQLRTAPGAYLAWFDGVRKDGAWLSPIVRVASVVVLVDPQSGEELSRTPLDVGAGIRIALPPRAPLLLVVLAVRNRP
jgi:hypothetical protein